MILRFNKDFIVPEHKKLIDVKLKVESFKINSHVIKKIAALRILVKKPPIIVIKDTD